MRTPWTMHCKFRASSSQGAEGHDQVHDIKPHICTILETVAVATSNGKCVECGFVVIVHGVESLCLLQRNSRRTQERDKARAEGPWAEQIPVGVLWNHRWPRYMFRTALKPVASMFNQNNLTRTSTISVQNDLCWLGSQPAHRWLKSAHGKANC